jgi:hypothetical protein
MKAVAIADLARPAYRRLPPHVKSQLNRIVWRMAAGDYTGITGWDGGVYSVTLGDGTFVVIEDRPSVVVVQHIIRLFGGE